MRAPSSTRCGPAAAMRASSCAFGSPQVVSAGSTGACARCPTRSVSTSSVATSPSAGTPSERSRACSELARRRVRDRRGSPDRARQRPALAGVRSCAQRAARPADRGVGARGPARATSWSCRVLRPHAASAQHGRRPSPARAPPERTRVAVQVSLSPVETAEGLLIASAIRPVIE